MATLLHSESRRLYSWWWDSHISPKNSKWLQENLTDMDAKVKSMIKLIEEDADSFARRAEMYYKKRPELMKLVEEFYRAYRALAERYDHATGELRHAHKTMAEAFPNQVPFALVEDSPSKSTGSEMDPQTPETSHPMRALFDPDDLHKDSGGLSGSDGHFMRKTGQYLGESDAGIRRRGLKQLHDIFETGEAATQHSGDGKVRKEKEKEEKIQDEMIQLSNENKNLKDEIVSMSERAVKAESELQDLKKALADGLAEKEAALLQYQQCLKKLSDMEEELSYAQNDFTRLSEKASRGAIEVQTLKEALNQIEAERDANLTKHKMYLEKISALEGMVSENQEDIKGLNERAIKAEIEVHSLHDEILRLESEKEAVLQQHKQCLEIISDLKNRISVAEEDARMYKIQADRAEVEVTALRKALADLNEEKAVLAHQYKLCLETISKLEDQISRANEDVKRLSNDVMVGTAKLKDAEEKCALLETSNLSLQTEADNLVKQIATKDQELSVKQQELEKLQTRLQDEHKRYAQIEAALGALQNLHTQSQEDQRALAMELKNGLEMLKDSEMFKHGLEEEIRRVKDVNFSLNQSKLASTVSLENMEKEILSLREMKERLEEEVLQQTGQSNSLQQEILCLKEEIMGLNWNYQTLIQQLEAAGLNPKSVEASIKSLQDENSRLRQIHEQGSNEKELLSKKLESMEEVLKKKASAESSLIDANGELERSREKVKALQESCQFLHGEKSALVAEKASLLSQIHAITDTMQKLLQKNAILENSLSTAKVELEGLREKSKGLQEICQLLKDEKQHLLRERDTLLLKLENVEGQLHCLEKRFTGLEEKYVGLEKEKAAMHFQMEELKVSVGLEKQEHRSSILQNETRLVTLESNIHFLQEENRSRKREFEEEFDKALKAQFEIFILQKFVKDMEEKNYGLIIECQKNVETSKLAEKLISELENENLEQQIESELLLDEIERLRLGIYQVFKALELGSDCIPEDKVENEHTFVHHILGNIEDMKRSLLKYEDKEQHLLVENGVLVTLLKELESKGMEIESKKIYLEQELRNMGEKVNVMNNDKHELLEMNKDLKLEVGRGHQHAAILEAEVENLCAKQDDLQKAYLKLQDAHSQVVAQNQSLLKKFSDLTEEKGMVDRVNDALFLELYTVENQSTVFRSFGAEKIEELKLLREDSLSLLAVNSELEKDINVLRGKLEMQEMENVILKDAVSRLEMELQGVKDSSLHLEKEMLSGKDVLAQREAKLMEAEMKLEAAAKLNSELHETVDILKIDCQESMLIRENLEKQIDYLCENVAVQDNKIASLHEENANLVSELDQLREDIEEKRIQEQNLSSELQEKNNEFELWEAEAASFYFDLQISSVHEVLFQNKVHELTGVCESLKEESATKTLEIEQMKGKISSMESEIEGLKSQLHAYAPVIAALQDDIASLEHNAFIQRKSDVADTHEPECFELVVNTPEKTPESSAETLYPMPNGIEDLLKLCARIKELEKAVGEMNANMSWRRSNAIQSRATMNEIEELKPQRSLRKDKNKHCEKRRGSEASDTPKSQRLKPKASEVRGGMLMKDIPLDQVSDNSLYESRRRGIVGVDDQMLELWETAENGNRNRVVSQLQKHTYKLKERDMGYNQFENVEPKSDHPSTDSEVEKELGVDKLQVSTRMPEASREVNNRKILERLASDAQKLTSLRINVDNLKRKLEMNKKTKKSKNVDCETVKEQLQEVEDTVSQLFLLNGQLVRNIEGNTVDSGSDGNTSAELKEAANAQTKKVLEQAQKGSERIGRLQLEVQKLQYILQKLEDEKKSKGRSRIFKSKTSIILRDFIYHGRKNSAKRKKVPACACFRPSSSRGTGSPSISGNGGSPLFIRNGGSPSVIRSVGSTSLRRSTSRFACLHRNLS